MRVIKISKSLLKAQAATLAAIVVATLIIHSVIIQIPSSPFAKINSFNELNHYNPMVVSTEFYHDESVLANVQDWMIFTPISFLIGGLVFGFLIGHSRTSASVARNAAATAVALSFVILALSWAGNYAMTAIAQAGPYATPQLAPNLRYYGMGLLQTVYWTIVFVAGSLAAAALRSSVRGKTNVGERRRSVPAATK